MRREQLTTDFKPPDLNMDSKSSLADLPSEVRLIVLEFALDEIRTYKTFDAKLQKFRLLTQPVSEAITPLLLLNKAINAEVEELLERNPYTVVLPYCRGRDVMEFLPDSIVAKAANIINQGSVYGTPQYLNASKYFPRLPSLQVEMPSSWTGTIRIDTEDEFVATLKGERNELIA